MNGQIIHRTDRVCLYRACALNLFLLFAICLPLKQRSLSPAHQCLCFAARLMCYAYRTQIGTLQGSEAAEYPRRDTVNEISLAETR
jgi:hypothetical protein